MVSVEPIIIEALETHNELDELKIRGSFSEIWENTEKGSRNENKFVINKSLAITAKYLM